MSVDDGHANEPAQHEQLITLTCKYDIEKASQEGVDVNLPAFFFPDLAKEEASQVAAGLTVTRVQSDQDLEKIAENVSSRIFRICSRSASTSQRHFSQPAVLSCVVTKMQH